MLEEPAYHIMMRHLACLLLFGFLFSCGATPALAQDPFGEEAIDDPFGGGGAAAGDTKLRPSDLVGEKYPALEAIRESNPSKPHQLALAIDALLAFGAGEEEEVAAKFHDLAKSYFDQLKSAALDEAELAELAGDVGPAIFFRMAESSVLGDDAPTFVQKVIDAAEAQSRRPDRLRQLARAAMNPNPEVRLRTLTDLKIAGTAAVPPLLELLADPATADGHRYLRDMLAHLGNFAVAPMIGALESPDQNFKVQVIQTLQQRGAGRANIYLLSAYLSPRSKPALRAAARGAIETLAGSPVSREQAISLLRGSIKGYLSGNYSLTEGPHDQVTLWHWDTSRRKLVSAKYSQRIAQAVTAARLGRELADAVPEDSQAESLFLLSNLEAAKLLAGWDELAAEGPAKDIVARIASLPPETLNATLARALDQDRIPAALAAIELLIPAGDHHLLHTGTTEPAALVRAASHTDRRVRYIATVALHQLDAGHPFPGSSALARNLRYFAGATGLRRAVVADPRLDRGSQTASLLTQVGLEADIATNGREAITLAMASPEVELMLIDFTIARAAIGEVLRQLRLDPRTAELPVGIIAHPKDLRAAQQHGDDDPLTLVFVRPRDVASVEHRVGQLTATLEDRFVASPQRLGMAAFALTMLTERVKSSRTPFDVTTLGSDITAAIYVEETSAAALGLLALVGTREAQRALLELASSSLQPIARRRAALKAFAANVRRNRVRLVTDDLLHQYELYNASETLDADTQAVLGGVLDVLEGNTTPPQAKKPPAQPTR